MGENEPLRVLGLPRRIRTMLPTRVPVAVFVLLAVPLAAHAVEDDRGKRGWYVSGGGGGVLGRAVDDDGRDTPSYFGFGGQLRVGEEVLDRLTIGLEFGGGGGSGEDFEAGLGGFFLQAGYRPGWLGEGLVFMLGTGVGGGSLTANSETAPEGAGGGAIYQAALSWELDFFGAPDEGIAFAPTLRWIFVPDTPDNEVQFSAFTLGLEIPYYAGR